jgi:hypothetical protein
VLLLLAVASLLPNLRAAIPDRTYYFRDVTLTYVPLRAFFAREAAAGRWPFWNPYIHEGAPFLMPFYPLELVQALWPGPAAVSWLLTLHFPIAALAMYALARDLGSGRLGAFASGALFAMGGLSLSSLNMHWFLQALALAPLVVLACRRAALRGGRWVLWAALALALAISTLAVEFVAQALALGVLLGLAAAPTRRGTLRSLAAVGLGLGLAALPIALAIGVLRGSVRGAGFAPGLALQNPFPLVGLVQLVVPNAFGSIAEPLRAWWGGRLFAQGAPYFMSLYLGPLALAAALSGARGLPRGLATALLAAAGLAFWYALGAAGGLAPLVSAAMPWFRYPSKALLTPYLVAAVLAGRGVEALHDEGPRRLAWMLAAVGVAVAAVAVTTLLARAALEEWLDISPAMSQAMEQTLLRDCGMALVAVALGLALLAALAWRVVPARGVAVAFVVLLLADLARGGRGFNPQTAPAFFALLPETAALRLSALDGGRVFALDAEESPSLRSFIRTRRPGVDLWSFFATRQGLTPYSNVLDGIEAADGRDRLSFVTAPPLVPSGEQDPGHLAEVLPRLRRAAVTRVVSLDALSDPALSHVGEAPVGPPGLVVHVYALSGASPRASVACRVRRAVDRSEALTMAAGEDEVVLEEEAAARCQRGSVRRHAVAPGEVRYDVEADAEGVLVARDSHAPGWMATVDGSPARVMRAFGRYQAVAVPGGSHEVVLRYRPPGLRGGLAATLLAALAAVALWLRPV